MNTPAPWPSAGPLPSHPRIFLEASAGTGKTFAIEGIVVQLIAEVGLAIDKLLVITFTTAATAELRDRVRQRLERVLQVLEGNQPPGDDALAARLLSAADRPVLALRLSQALADIDRAAISTIHAFCQRVLQELAFESGQEAELELLGEPSEIRDQLVADALASTFAQVDEADLALLADMGWTPAQLGQVAKAMTGPTEPQLRPRPDPQLSDAASVLQRWRDALADFTGWWRGPQGRAANASWETQRAGLGRAPASVDATVQAWVDAGGPRTDRPYAKNTQWLSVDVLRAKWNPKGGPIEQYPGFALAERISALWDLQDQLWPQPLVQFGAGVRARFQAEIDRRAQLTYDGMLSRLADKLAQDAAAGVTTLADAIRSRYRVALVDEFQDTDASQWQTLDLVFGRADTRFFVVGDPKQSIYRFRGADLDVYLAARRDAACYQLDTNFRTDAPLVQTLNGLWTVADLPLSTSDVGEPVRYLPVHADKGLRIDHLPPSPGALERPRRLLEMRVCTARTEGQEPDSKPKKADVTAMLAQVCARECWTLLTAQPQLLAKGATEPRPLAPGDIAVLVQSHDEAAAVAKHLARLGIPAVAAGRGSIFHSEALGWLVAWLDALASPAQERPARFLAVSPLLGWTADQLARSVREPDSGEALDDDQRAWQTLRQHLASLSNSWTTQGFARVLEHTLDRYDVVRRLLGSIWGERAATDLRHLVELCQAEDRRTRAGPRGLAEWLRARQAGADDKNDEQATRLESDAAAVQLVTVHSSKGLEYPVVLLPFGWPPRTDAEKRQPLLIRASGTPLLDMSTSGTADREQARRYNAQAAEAEALRLLYVAMTRARHHLVVWLNRYDGLAQGPLARLILGSATQAQAAQGAAQVDLFDLVQQRLTALADDPQVRIGTSEEPPPAELPAWKPSRADGQPRPSALPFDTRLVLGAHWQVASFTSLSAGRSADDDEPTRALATTAVPQPVAARDDDSGEDGARLEPADLGDLDANPWMLAKAPGADLPGGTATGDWIHGVLEDLAFSTQPGADLVAKDGRPARELVDELAQRYGVAMPRGKGAADPRVRLAELLPGWLDTPLAGSGPNSLQLPADFALRQLSPGDRIDELGFDLRLGAGADYRAPPSSQRDRSSGCIDPNGVRLAFELGAQASGFGGAAWCRAMLDRAATKNTTLLPEIAGFLTGFVDLTFRVGGSGADGRYFIADYKSNAIRGPDWLAGRLTLAAKRAGVELPRLANVHYTRPLLQWAMAHAGYHLQALVYTVALHRLLQTRLGSAYDYDRHVGGHLYLFLKGMAGPATPRWDHSCLGVWADRWPTQAVLALDHALLGVRSAGAT